MDGVKGFHPILDKYFPEADAHRKSPVSESFYNKVAGHYENRKIRPMKIGLMKIGLMKIGNHHGFFPGNFSEHLLCPVL